MLKTMKEIIEESFGQYAGAVAQSRAFVDVRDALKPSNRQINYCLYTDKFLPSKPFKKTLKAIGSIARMYIHGDSSAEGIIMRSGQPFAMRYPLIEVEGNGGNLMMSGNWAAPRYTSSRLSNFSTLMFDDINKNTIETWINNYDDTEQYPSVLPSKGFYNIVNGTSGIGVGVASSIPQFNIRDVNAALEKLLLNPDCDFEDIYCRPDFATGGYLINEPEVKEALKYGSKKLAKQNESNGASCKIRAKIDYDSKENCLVVTELPYSVYTNTICGQLESIIEDTESNPGIDRFNDLTGVSPLIKIYLIKGANPKKVIKFLFKNTSLQYHFAINMTMLDMGKYPKVFSWKEALQAHIDHEKIVYRRGFEFDLNKIKNRIHIIDGLLICLASIDEVVAEIKASKSTAEAASRLIKKFLLDEEQAKAVLDMKLARLAHSEVKKLEDEKAELIVEKDKIENILSTPALFNNELITTWRSVSSKYGDDYRTKIITITEEDEEEENLPEPEKCVVIMTKNGDVKRIKADSFKVQNRNGKGVKSLDDITFDPITTNTVDNLLIFTTKGKMYKILVDNIPEGTNTSKGINISMLIDMDSGEQVAAITSLHRKTDEKYVIFITKHGMIKKSSIEEYMKIKRGSGITALKLNDNDSIVNVVFADNEDLVLVTKNGYGIHFETSNIASVGRAALGVKSIKLSENDEVLTGMTITRKSKYLAIFSENGSGKKISLEEIPCQGRNGKGLIIYKPSDVTGNIVGALAVNDNDSILLLGRPNSICISAKDIPLLSRTGIGNIMIKGSKLNSVASL